MLSEELRVVPGMSRGKSSPQFTAACRLILRKSIPKPIPGVFN